MTTQTAQNLINDARDEVERAAHGTPASQAQRIRAGESDDARLRLLVQLSNALEAATTIDEARLSAVLKEHWVDIYRGIGTVCRCGAQFPFTPNLVEHQTQAILRVLRGEDQ